MHLSWVKLEEACHNLNKINHSLNYSKNIFLLMYLRISRKRGTSWAEHNVAMSYLDILAGNTYWPYTGHLAACHYSFALFFPG